MKAVNLRDQISARQRALAGDGRVGQRTSMHSATATAARLRHGVGGLAPSPLLTLYTTPMIYLYLGRLQSWLHDGRVQRTEEDMRAAVAE